MECDQTQRLNAFHDGELSARDAAEVVRHLEACSACRAELETLQRMSRVFAALPTPSISAAALSRAHALVDRVASLDSMADAEPAVDSSVRRMAFALTSLAASILIIATAWMFVGDPGETNAQPQIAIVQQPQWERVAMTLRADRFDLPEGSPTQMLADASSNDARVADWMIRSLSR